ncbi:hypothetical protein D3C72_2159310 [compost metagenome]
MHSDRNVSVKLTLNQVLIRGILLDFGVTLYYAGFFIMGMMACLNLGELPKDELYNV